MILKKICIKNIRSYTFQEIEFPIGSLLLAGDVGAGKTSLLLAVEYALFGLQPGQNSSALLRNTASNGEVSLLCEIDGKEVLLERKLKRGSKNITNEYAAITIDGEKYECSVTELKKKVLTLLGYPSEFIKKNNLLYRYTVYTPQENMKHIILEDPEIRLNILRHIFGVDKYKIIRENAQKALFSLREDIKLIQGEIKNIDQDLSILIDYQKKISLLQVSYEDKLKELDLAIKYRKLSEEQYKQVINKIKEKEKLEAELEKVNVMIVSKKEALFSIEKESNSLHKEISEEKAFDEKLLLELSKELEAQQVLISNLEELYIQKKSRLVYLNQQEKDTTAKKERVFSIDICPTCLQDVPLAHKHNILLETEKNLSQLSKEKKSISEEEIALSNKIILEEEKLAKLEEQRMHYEILKSRVKYIEQNRKKLQELIKTLDSLKKDISLLEKHNLAVKEGLFNLSNLNPLLKMREEELRKSQSTERQAEIRLAEIKKEQELTQQEIGLISKRLAEKEESRSKLVKIQEISDWLSNEFLSLIQFTENNVLLQLRAEFSKIFSKWCQILAPDSFDVHLDETFTPIIMQGEIEMSYSFLSGGERTAVALAYRLALNQTINSVMSQMKTKDLLILDEPTEGFSEAQLEKMREVLIELNVKQLILVSHEPKIENFVENVLKIKKEGGASILE